MLLLLQQLSQSAYKGKQMAHFASAY